MRLILLIALISASLAVQGCFWQSRKADALQPWEITADPESIRYEIITENSAPVGQWSLSYGSHDRYPPEGMTQDVAFDNTGNIYVTDVFYIGVDCARGGPDGIYTGRSGSLASLRKLDQVGNVLWYHSWPSSMFCHVWHEANSVEIDRVGNVYIAGIFMELMEFETDSETVSLISEGTADAFLSKFNPDGALIWARHWGGEASDRATDLAIDDEGNLYVAGHYYGECDFDPGPEDTYHSSDEDLDNFVSKVNSDGEFLWVYTWHSESMEVAIELGPAGLIWVSSALTLTALNSADGSNQSEFTLQRPFSDFAVMADGTIICVGPALQQGGSQAYLNALDDAGNVLFNRTWGNHGTRVVSVATDTMSRIYVLGSFNRDTDFAPGDDVDNRVFPEDPEGGYTPPQSYVSIFDASGERIVTITWDHISYPGRIELDSQDYSYATGWSSKPRYAVLSRLAPIE